MDSKKCGSTPLSRLRWQCRRGMKELDVLLTGYLDEKYDAAPDSDKAAFRAVLALSDPELVGYLLQRQQPESAAIARIVDHILDRAQS